jgi:hypothetical protein
MIDGIFLATDDLGLVPFKKYNILLDISYDDLS